MKLSNLMFTKRIGLGTLALALLASAACAGGCYTQVTRATGFGADQYTVSEPYQRNSALDDWIWGKPAPPSNGTRLK